MSDERAITHMAEEWLNFVQGDSTGFNFLMLKILRRIQEIEADKETEK